jgi:hypothetical protein
MANMDGVCECDCVSETVRVCERFGFGPVSAKRERERVLIFLWSRKREELLFPRARGLFLHAQCYLFAGR